jgi:hypothetical protein|tara:strand:- start:62 stop:343 length:282 start_codon:yes stop_codon:yes gene_type:complete
MNDSNIAILVDDGNGRIVIGTNRVNRDSMMGQILLYLMDPVGRMVETKELAREVGSRDIGSMLTTLGNMVEAADLGYGIVRKNGYTSLQSTDQ